MLNGNRPVVGADLFNRARWQAKKIAAGDRVAGEQEAEHNRGVPAARTEAVGKLQEFFARAAQPAPYRGRNRGGHDCHTPPCQSA